MKSHSRYRIDMLAFVVATLCLLLATTFSHGQITQPYTVDRVFYVTPTGVDTNPGTQVQPFKTIGAANTAITKARWSRPTTSNDCIDIAAGTYAAPWPISIDSDNVVVRASGNGRAVFNCDQTGINIAGHKGIHFVGIDMRTTAVYDRSLEGVGFNVFRSAGVAPDDVTFDNCCAWGFAQGISFLSDNGGRIRVWNCSLCNNVQTINGRPQKSQGIYMEGACPDVRSTVFGFNGWSGKEDLSDPTIVTALMFSHGCYVSMSHAPQPGFFQGNFYIANAASGLQLRSGGTSCGEVFVTNGVACDEFTDGAVGVITGNLVLGNHEPGLWSGGGLLGQSERQHIAGNLFLRANPTASAALLLGWNSSGNDVTGGLKPSPLSSADVAGNSGFWAGPVTSYYVPRTFQTTAGNPIFAAPPSLPDLTDYAKSIGFPGSTHRDLIAWLRDNPDKVNAANCIQWASDISVKLMQPTVGPVPATQPVQFDVTLHVDGTKVTVK